MANIKSAKKRIKTINRQKTENRLIKSTMSTYIKKYKKLLVAEDFKGAEEQLKITVAYIDAASSKGVIHKNNASRKISRLTAALHKLQNKQPVSVKEEKVEETKVEEQVKEEKPTKATTTKTVEKTKTPAKEKADKAPVKKPATKTAKTTKTTK